MITWNELVIHGLFKRLKDPNIVIYFINIMKPIRRTFLENESREWHQSLRIKQEERWNRVSNLMHKKNYTQIHSSVPITCTLPFDGGMWRNSQMLLKSIRYFRGGFIKSSFTFEASNFHLDQPYSEKIKTINLIMDNSIEGDNFRNMWSNRLIEEALNDNIINRDNEIDSEDDTIDYTYLLISTLSSGISEFKILDIIN